MRAWMRWMGVAVVGVILTVGLLPVAAQGGLIDGGFEGSYTGRGRPDLNIPADWGLWVSETPRTETWMNLPVVAFPHRGPDPSPHTGTLALNFNKGFATYTAAIYQQAATTVGTPITASAWGFLRTCNIPENSDRCASEPGSGAYMRVGIDPNGGTNPYDGDVVWSANSTPHEVWSQMTASTTATGATITVFLFTTQQWPRQLNNAYWDDAAVTGAGGVPAGGGVISGGATTVPGTPLPPPTATPPPFVAFVSAQAPQADGSIVHTVQPGDTVDSIAFAYGTSRASILELNSLRSGTFIQIGQQLLVQVAPEATAVPTDAPTQTPPPTDPPPTIPPTQQGNGAISSIASLVTSTPTLIPPTRVPTSAPTTVPATSIPRPATIAAGVPNADGSVNFAPTNPTPTATPFGFDPAAPAPVASVASGIVLPPIDASAMTGSVCALMYDDANQNRIQENDETSGVAEGIVQLLTQEGSGVIGQAATLGTGEPLCFSDLSPGDYLLAAAAPANFGLTTPDQLRVRVSAGERIILGFGVAAGFVPSIPAADAGDTALSSEESTVPGIPPTDNVGVVVFGAGIAVAITGLAISFLISRR